MYILLCEQQVVYKFGYLVPVHISYISENAEYKKYDYDDEKRFPVSLRRLVFLELVRIAARENISHI